MVRTQFVQNMDTNTILQMLAALQLLTFMLGRFLLQIPGERILDQ